MDKKKEVGKKKIRIVKIQKRSNGENKLIKSVGTLGKQRGWKGQQYVQQQQER